MKEVKYLEGLRVYQQARELVRQLYSLTKSGAIAKDFALVDQMRRAAVSMLSNIAEGFERQTNAEFAQFLFVSKGSCGELRAQGLVAFDQGHWSKDEYEGASWLVVGRSAQGSQT